MGLKSCKNLALEISWSKKDFTLLYSFLHSQKLNLQLEKYSWYLHNFEIKSEISLFLGKTVRKAAAGVCQGSTQLLLFRIDFDKIGPILLFQIAFPHLASLSKISWISISSEFLKAEEFSWLFCLVIRASVTIATSTLKFSQGVLWK